MSHLLRICTFSNDLDLSDKSLKNQGCTMQCKINIGYIHYNQISIHTLPAIGGEC